MFGRRVVSRVEQHETVTLIAPSPDSYALPVAKKVVSGGGGGGDHDALPRRRDACRSLPWIRSHRQASFCVTRIQSSLCNRRS